MTAPVKFACLLPDGATGKNRVDAPATTELGEVQQISLAGLRHWLAADESNNELLKAYLHEGGQCWCLCLMR
jgi:hypothetical protein